MAIPALTIGLDPLFKVCYKLRVTDILQLQKARIIRKDIPETSDLMCLNGHIIQKVEIMGIVVRVDKRERFISYGVDDGTGVISCTVWKNSNNEQVISMASLPRSLQEKFAAITSHYQSSVHEGYSLGDLVQIQGRVRVHRDMNEISALDHRKIENPNVELERILDLPKFYKLYKQPVILPTKVEEHLRKMNDKENPLNETVLQDAITQYIQQYKCQLTEFTVEKLVSLPCLTQLFSSNQIDPGKIQAYIPVVQSVLKTMEEKVGCVYQRSDLPHLYQVVSSDSPLAARVKRLLLEACQEGKNAEMGCHINHVQMVLKRSSQYREVPMTVLNYLFECLEYSGDVIQVVPCRYMAMS